MRGTDRVSPRKVSAVSRSAMPSMVATIALPIGFTEVSLMLRPSDAANGL